MSSGELEKNHKREWTRDQENQSPGGLWLRGPHRAWMIGYLVLAILAFALLAFLATRTPHFGFDVPIARAIQSPHSPTLDLVMELVGLPGFGNTAILLYGIFVVILLVCRMKWAALDVGLVGSLSGVVTTGIRYWVNQPRPSPDLVRVMQEIEGGHYSFPSGHTVGFTAVLGFLIYVGLTEVKPTWHRNLLLAFYLLYIVLVGISRVYTGEHWPSDVLGGYLLGSIWLVLMILLYQWLRARAARHAVERTSDEPNS